MSVKLLTEHRLKFLSLKGGCTGSSESTLVKMPHCWKSHVVAHTRHLVQIFLEATVCTVTLHHVQMNFFAKLPAVTVKPVYNGHSQKDRKLGFKTN